MIVRGTRQIPGCAAASVASHARAVAGLVKQEITQRRLCWVFLLEHEADGCSGGRQPHRQTHTHGLIRISQAV